MAAEGRWAAAMVLRHLGWTAAVAGGGLLPVAGLAGCRWAGGKEGMGGEGGGTRCCVPMRQGRATVHDGAQRGALCRRLCGSVPPPNTFSDPSHDLFCTHSPPPAAFVC